MRRWIGFALSGLVGLGLFLWGCALQPDDAALEMPVPRERLRQPDPVPILQENQGGGWSAWVDAAREEQRAEDFRLAGLLVMALSLLTPFLLRLRRRLRRRQASRSRSRSWQEMSY